MAAGNAQHRNGISWQSIEMTAYHFARRTAAAHQHALRWHRTTFFIKCHRRNGGVINENDGGMSRQRINENKQHGIVVCVISE